MCLTLDRLKGILNLLQQYPASSSSEIVLDLNIIIPNFEIRAVSDLRSYFKNEISSGTTVPIDAIVDCLRILKAIERCEFWTLNESPNDKCWGAAEARPRKFYRTPANDPPLLQVPAKLPEYGSTENAKNGRIGPTTRADDQSDCADDESDCADDQSDCADDESDCADDQSECEDDQSFGENRAQSDRQDKKISRQQRYLEKKKKDPEWILKQRQYQRDYKRKTRGTKQEKWKRLLRRDPDTAARQERWRLQKREQRKARKEGQ